LLQQQQHEQQQQQIIDIENNKIKNPTINGPINCANGDAIDLARVIPVLILSLFVITDVNKSTLY
jgi:hypothetical protein